MRYFIAFESGPQSAQSVSTRLILRHFCDRVVTSFAGVVWSTTGSRTNYSVVMLSLRKTKSFTVGNQSNLLYSFCFRARENN